MKSINATGVLVAVVLLVAQERAAAIIWCHDYTMYRVTGTDPAPVSGSSTAGASVGDLRTILAEFLSRPYIPRPGQPLYVWRRAAREP